MKLKKEQLIEFGESLIKNYKYSLIFKQKIRVVVNEKYYLENLIINNELKVIEEVFNSLSLTERKLLYLVYFKDNLSKTKIACNLYISRSTVYRLRNKALFHIAKNWLKDTKMAKK